MVTLLQVQQDSYNLLLATLDVILDKLRHGKSCVKIPFKPHSAYM